MSRPAVRVVRAQQYGLCPACTGAITPGMRIARHWPDTRWVHVACQRKASDGADIDLRPDRKGPGRITAAVRQRQKTGKQHHGTEDEAR